MAETSAFAPDPPILPSYITNHGILFLHPGYASPNNVLFRLPSNDGDSERHTPGVHHRTALTACQIVANNAFAGFLALDASGEKRADTAVGLNEILTDREYFFVVPGNIRYPVVPSFRDWEFPHYRFPKFWPYLPPAEGPHSNLCVVTQNSWALSKAHIIPAIEKEWFKRNDMSRYSNSRYPDIDDIKNILSLRADVHICLDRHMFALVPKIEMFETNSSTEQTENHTYTLQVLTDDSAQFTKAFHNILLPHLQGVAAEYLFARFALATFISVKPFVLKGFTRHIARFIARDENKGAENICEDVGGESLESQYGGGKSRNASPTERKKESENEEEQEEVNENEIDYTMSWDKCFNHSHCIKIIDYEQEVAEAASLDKDATDLNCVNVLAYEQHRGRPRKRQKALDRLDGYCDSLFFKDNTVLEEWKGDEDNDLPSLCNSESSSNSDL